jgi:hypothetical protein
MVSPRRGGDDNHRSCAAQSSHQRASLARPRHFSTTMALGFFSNVGAVM